MGQKRRHSKAKPNSGLLKCLVTIAIIDLFAFQAFDVQLNVILAKNHRKFVSPSSGSFDIDKMEMSEIISMHSRSSYQHPHFNALQSRKSFSSARNDQTSVGHTMRVLQDLGISQSNIESEGLSDKLPPWSQISANYGEDPVVLGLERCQAYRETVPVAKRMVGLAGLFSSGTNLMHHLLLNNCEPPKGGQKAQKTFQWQVPWGKHNPAGVRMKYAAQDHEFTNQTAVLPVVTVRHPITWLNALCNHGYSLHWSHDTALCDSTLQLDHIVEAKFGYTNQSVVYDSLIDVWRNWNLQYFQENKYPLVMIRLEDIVYRPKQVVTEICHCIGGELYSDKPFSVFENSMNDGNGHGEHRSDGILSAFVKFAKPVKEWRQKFSSNDWVVIDKVLQDDKGLLSAFNYLMPNV